jgi:sialate O-acetylesterase
MVMLLFAGVMDAQQTAEKVRVACIGNSVTYGYKVPDRDVNGYPAQLQQMLGNDYEVKNFGFSGATLLRKGHKPYWEQTEFVQAREFEADIVIIHLGLNDTDPRNWPNYRDDFRKDYYDLIDAFRKVNPKADVWICQMTPIFHQHPRFKSGTRDWFWQIQEQIKQIANIKETGLIDLHSPLYHRPDLFPDALHPNAEGARILAETVCQEITGDFGGLQLPGIFSNHMVLQREKPIPVYGVANRGEEITVQMDGETVLVSADEHGHWQVELPAMNAGGPHTLQVKSEQRSIVVKDVLIGEVWLCSGQSNMAFTLNQSRTGKIDLPKATNDHLRFYHMKQQANCSAQVWDKETLNKVNQLDFFEADWERCTRESAAAFSAIGYYYGQAIQEQLNVPVGIILNAVGGSTTESWIDRKSLEHHSELVDVLYNWAENDFVQKWCRERAQTNLKKSENPLQRHPFQPAYLYEAGIKPLRNFQIKGVLWYQGESNAHNVEFHEVLFPEMIRSWRRTWGYEFPFYYVQLSSLNRPTWGHFRDSQRRLQVRVPHSGMVVSSDLGHQSDVHPTDKKPIGIRLCKLALAKTYGQSVEYCGPVVEQIDFEKNPVIVKFTHAHGLQVKNGQKILGFEVAGEDGLFYPAEAQIVGESIQLISNQVRTGIKDVRYGWEPFTNANLINSEGFPASTFTTEYEKTKNRNHEKDANN